MLAKECEDLVIEPRRMAKLHRHTVGWLQKGEESLQSRHVFPEVGRQLEQERAESLLQYADRLEENGRQFADISEPLVVGDPLCALKVKRKPAGTWLAHSCRVAASGIL